MPSMFDNVDLDASEPIVTPADVIRKGKKSVPYTEDPEILARLSRVAAMMLKGQPAWKIAETLGYPIGSAKRDIARVRAIWRKEAKDKLSSHKDAALAQYQLALAKAWEMVEATPDKADRYLSLVIQIQERIDSITGADAPAQVEIKKEITVKNIDQVRAERWQQVRQALGVFGESEP